MRLKDLTVVAVMKDAVSAFKNNLKLELPQDELFRKEMLDKFWGNCKGEQRVQKEKEMKQEVMDAIGNKEFGIIRFDDSVWGDNYSPIPRVKIMAMLRKNAPKIIAYQEVIESLGFIVDDKEFVRHVSGWAGVLNSLEIEFYQNNAEGHNSMAISRRINSARM